ncbi:helix-turn-helix transcriptional regulator [Pontibacter sp. BT310]|uniref:Helix-turn-helix domain-containing protein n=1 Tax=Pontibacter populi TaxID=890055 RepID=A0ABS6XFP8_9BACT|nr:MULTISPECIES: helix-turn-helix transcriptional regulator [Pontibacter]MBJ6119494.1 helix-turn-helix transcriptional regulator [Pontibacter sp. BT310]MBR0571922.1 helix-turn-helix transcriptional regulator [Microvirga sp. STS03]MBW3366348.1 helix-turn-helix domain-containing protein [Pontibacter populi]
MGNGYDYYDLMIDELIKLRKEKGLSQNDLALKIQSSLSYIQDIENQTIMLEPREMTFILAVLGYDTFELFRRVKLRKENSSGLDS